LHLVSIYNLPKVCLFRLSADSSVMGVIDIGRVPTESHAVAAGRR